MNFAQTEASYKKAPFGILIYFVHHMMCGRSRTLFPALVCQMKQSSSSFSASSSSSYSSLVRFPNPLAPGHPDTCQLRNPSIRPTSNRRLVHPSTLLCKFTKNIYVKINNLSLFLLDAFAAKKYYHLLFICDLS